MTKLAVEELVRLTTPIMAQQNPTLFAHTSLVNQGGKKHALCVTLYAPSYSKDIVSGLEVFPKAPVASRGRRFHQQHLDLTHPIINCLQLILNSNEEWVTMNENLNKPTRHGLSLGNVMSTIEASPDLPSMIQPFGLHDIKLHEYQKCVSC